MTGAYFRKYWRDRRGNLSITTAIVGVMLLTAVGASLDGGRMITTKAKLQSITDAAALSAATPEKASPNQRRQLALRSIETHARRHTGMALGTPRIDVRGSSDVEVALSAETSMLFGAFLGKQSRQVSVSSLAQEALGGSASNAISISVVMDLSESMSTRFDKGSRVASVKAAISDTFRTIENSLGGEALAATRFSTGLYPFNWGMVDGEVVALEPGTDTVVDAMAFMSMREGSVSSESFEQAVADQMAAEKTEGSRERYVVYLTDGDVDDEKGDEPGRMLSDADMFMDGHTAQCRKDKEKLDKATDDVRKHLSKLAGESGKKCANPKHNHMTGNFPDLAGIVDLLQPEDLLMEARTIVNDNRGLGGDDVNVKPLENAIKRHEKAERSVVMSCKPVQTMRVVDACEKARDNDISVIAVDLSGEEGRARKITDLCMGIVEDEVSASERERKQDDKGRKNDGKTLPGNLEVTFSADGESMSASVSSLDELRAILSTMQPETGKGTRQVRLVR
ncbi:MAG: TadE/TadG family type IV pilus assembly protein [Pseudomonadota bacterium]